MGDNIPDTMDIPGDIEDDILRDFLESDSNLDDLPMNCSKLQHSIKQSIDFTKNHTSSYEPGETKSTNHLILEMNEFYIEMAEKLKELELNSYKSIMDDGDDGDVEDTNSVLYDVVNAIRKQRNDPRTKKQIEAVLKLDQLMEKKYETIKKEREERLKIQNSLCELIEKQDGKHAPSRIFKNLCDMESKKYKRSSNSSKINELEEEEAAANDQIPVKLPKRENKFIKRNIELAKNTPTMYNSAYSLTDEEKLKLDELLADLDSVNAEESEIKKSSGSLENDEAVTTTDSNTDYPFSLSQSDLTRMKELDTELESISEVSLLETKEKPLERNQSDWKNKERLKQINQQLEKLQSERESFQYTPTEVILPEESNSEENNDGSEGEAMSYGELQERSQEILEHIANIIEHTNITSEEETEGKAETIEEE